MAETGDGRVAVAAASALPSGFLADTGAVGAPVGLQELVDAAGRTVTKEGSPVAPPPFAREGRWRRWRGE